jgi:ADP-heptose:LPS heptosyltransferase
VLVYREQGLGDEIMFASCLGDLMRSGARCLVDCDPRLRPLLRRSFPEIEVVEDIDALEMGHSTGSRTIDACLPIGSLPGVFRTSRAAFEPARAYLRADASKASGWRERLAALGPGRKIGIAWRGGLFKTGRALRSLTLDQLLPLLRMQEVHWINLQHRDDSAERERIQREHGVQLTTWSEALQELDETAALVSELDLVVTVCSSIVHLAGALGRPVWTLTPAAPAWRYFLAGDSLPWYPAVRLFRQRAAGDWPPVVDDIASALRAGQPAG